MLFLTEVWRYSVVRAGALITPIAAMVTVLAPVAGRVADRVGHRVLVVPAGLFWLSGGLWLLVGAGDMPDLLHVWFPAAFLLGIGSGLGWPTIHGIPMIGIEPKDFSAAVATNQTVLRVVGFLGVAIAITLISGAGGATMSPFRRLFVLMADIAERDGHAVEAQEAMRATANAEPDPVWQCEACGTVHSGWTAVCPACGTHGRVAWSAGQLGAGGSAALIRPSRIRDAITG